MNSDDIANILDRANDLLEEGKPAETLRCLAQISSANVSTDDRIEAAALRAWALSELGRHEQALQTLEALLDEYPDSARLHAARGVVLSNADALEEAREALEEAFELDDNDEVTLGNLALVYEKLRDYEQAQALYERAMERGVEIDWALQRLAAVLTELGDYRGARRTLRRYLSIVPDDATQWIALGILFSDDEEYEDALACYAEAEKHAPESGWLRLNWGVTAVRAGKLELAEQQLQALETCAPRSARRWLLRAFIDEERGDLPAAERHYFQALGGLDEQDSEDFAYALEMAIDFFARLQRSDVCEELFKRAYAANLCGVELCEAYREATGRHLDEGTWFSVVVEADYREGLQEIPDRGMSVDARPARFLRNYQIVAKDRDDAMGELLNFTRRLGETGVRVREFVNEEPIEDAYTGIYEIERKALVFAD